MSSVKFSVNVNGWPRYLMPKIWTAWVGRTNVTDDRQTTDGRAIAYSEREFTFAKNQWVCGRLQLSADIPVRYKMCMLNHCLEVYKWSSGNELVPDRQWFNTFLLHDLSPDGGTYPTILFCKLIAVTRETKVTLSNRTEPKKVVILECRTNHTNGNTGAS